MTVGTGEYFGILGVAGSESVVVYAAVEVAAAAHYRGVAALQLLESIEYGHASAVCPVAFVAVVHIFYVFNLVVTDEGEA